MSPAVESSLGIVAYLALFFAVGFAFLFVNLLVGWLVRPRVPEAEKAEIYECGEPTIGSSFVQFDLRFYVVALLFIIFDVEIAFFFPWATVFGKATNLADPALPVVEQGQLTAAAAGLFQELGAAAPAAPTEGGIQEGARALALFSIIDIFVFFGVLLVGFAYVWKRGDLNWVRAISAERAARPDEEAPTPTPRPSESALSA